MQKIIKIKVNKKYVKEPWGNFNDCHICNAMKQGRGNTAEELTKIFKEAEKLQKNSISF